MKDDWTGFGFMINWTECMVGPLTYSVPLLPGPQVGLLLDHQRQGLRHLADLEGERVKVFCRGGKSDLSEPPQNDTYVYGAHVTLHAPPLLIASWSTVQFEKTKLEPR
jgi:hypothetical protein